LSLAEVRENEREEKKRECVKPWFHESDCVFDDN
jgi:hypothetical protein